LHRKRAFSIKRVNKIRNLLEEGKLWLIVPNAAKK
jgi:hypothetical protein